jgi:flagellar protein FliO/FliZ
MILALLAIGSRSIAATKQGEEWMTESLFGTEMPLAIQFCLAFLVMLGLIGTIAWAVRRFGTGLSGGVSSRGRHSRISIIESTSVDRDRRLVLVGRDNIELLLLIGGPTDLVIETNVIGALVVPRDAQVTRPPAPTMLPQPSDAPLLDKVYMQRQPEPVTMPRTAPRIEQPQTPAVLPHPTRAETSTRLQPDTLAALVDNLSNRSPSLRKTPNAVTRLHPTETQPHLWPGPQVELQPKSRMVMPPRASEQPAIAPTESTPDEDLGDLTRRLEALLRKSSATTSERLSIIPIREATLPEQPTAAVPTPPSPVRAAYSSERKPLRAEANSNQGNATNDGFEQKLAKLLGRSAN